MIARFWSPKAALSRATFFCILFSIGLAGLLAAGAIRRVRLPHGAGMADLLAAINADADLHGLLAMLSGSLLALAGLGLLRAITLRRGRA